MLEVASRLRLQRRRRRYYTNGGTPSLQCIQNAFYVACGEEVALHRVAEVFVAFASHGRRVVWADETVGSVFQCDS